MTDIKCSQCEEKLFDYHEGRLDAAIAGRISQHLERCDDCALLLNDIWQMGLVSTRWQDETLPAWDRTFGRHAQSQWQLPQLLATAASVLALVMVLTGTRITTTENGISLTTGNGTDQVKDYVTADQFAAFTERQDEGLRELAARQVASDQLVLRSVIETSRQERKEDMSMLVSYMNASQAKQYQQTEENLRYLLASQAEDERDIKQLSQAFARIGAQRGSDM